MSRRGQALLELAIVGSLLLLVLDMLINYGLRSDYTQQAMMSTFRHALATTAEQPVTGQPSGTVVIAMEDRRVPSSGSFNLGFSLPVGASAGGLIRNWRLDQTPDAADELPRQRILVGSQELDCPGSQAVGCAVSGFRTERNVPEASLARYHFIYSASNVTDLGAGECLELGERPVPGVGNRSGQAGGTTQQFCVRPSKHLRIMDSCEGELIDYEFCLKRARMLTDANFCKQECQRDPQETTCNTLCDAAKTMHLPWYARREAAAASFTLLEDLFHPPATRQGMERLSIERLGLQPGYARRTQIGDPADVSAITQIDTEPEGGLTLPSTSLTAGQAGLYKHESPTNTRTQVSVSVEETAERRFFFLQKPLSYEEDFTDTPTAVVRDELVPQRLSLSSSQPCRRDSPEGTMVSCNDLDSFVDWSTPK